MSGWFLLNTPRLMPCVHGWPSSDARSVAVRAPPPLQAHARPHVRDIHVCDEYKVPSGCLPPTSSSNSSLLSRTGAPRSSSRRRQNGGLCSQGAVSVPWSRRRAGAQPPSVWHHPAHVRTPQLRPLHASCMGSPDERKGAASPFTLCRARAALGAKPCACVSHRLCIARLHDARRSDFSNLPPRRAAGLGWYERRDDAWRGPLRATAGAVQRDRCRPSQAAG